MSKRIAFLFPGQGAQYPGMGQDFYEEFEQAKQVFDLADSILEEEFSKLIFEGPKDELTLTKNSQLAIFIVSAAILSVVQSQFPDLKPGVCAGLSLGEYTALFASGKMAFQDVLSLVKARATFMHQACQTNPGTLNVVLGLDLTSVNDVISSHEDVWIANLNCPGQIVIAGTHSGLEKVAPILKEKGAKRVLPLDVSGAFHSGLMKPAQDQLESLIDSAPMETSETKLVMNTPGDFVESPDDMRSYLISQVTHPVLWQKGIEAIEKQGVDLFIEMGPGQLAGINKRIGVKAPIVSIEKLADLEALKQALEEPNHAAT